MFAIPASRETRPVSVLLGGTGKAGPSPRPVLAALLQRCSWSEIRPLPAQAMRSTPSCTCRSRPTASESPPWQSSLQ